jgi:hypothetical protein
VKGIEMDQPRAADVSSQASLRSTGSLEYSATSDDDSSTRAPSRGGSAWSWAQYGILCVIVAVMWAPRWRGPLDMRWDAGVYYVLGTSIAEGKGYRLLNEPGEIAAVQYPPLLPAVVAAHQWILESDDLTVVGPWLRGWAFATNLAFVLLAYVLLKRFVSSWLATAGAACAALYINTLYLSDSLYTEIPFALATMIFLLAIGGGAGRALRPSPSWRAESLAALAAVAAYLLRTAGIALLAAWVVDALLARRWKLAVARAAVAAIPFIAWQGYVWSIANGPEYQRVAYAYQRAPYYYSNVTYGENTALSDPFKPEDGPATPAARRKQMLRNTYELALSTGSAMSTFPDIWASEFRYIGWKVLGITGTRRWDRLTYVPLVTLALFAAAGAVIVWRSGGARPIVLYALFTYGLLLLIPWPQQFVRYLMPLAPVLWLFGLVALQTLMSLGSTVRTRRLVTGFATIVLVGVIGTQVWALAWSFKGSVNEVTYYARDGHTTTGKLLYFSPPWQGLLESLQWAREHGEGDDVVATTIPHTAYAWTGMKAVLPPLERNREEALRLLDTVPARYVVTDVIQYPRISQRYVMPAVSNDPRWRKVFTSSVGSSNVYERIPPGEVPRTTTAPTATLPANEGSR